MAIGLELAGYAIIALAMAHLAIGLAERAARRAHGARLARIERDRFRAEADLVLARSREARERIAHSWSGTRKLRVTRRTVEGDGVLSLEVVAHDGRPLPPYLPGQFITLRVRLPGAAVPAVRCYSLSGAPQASETWRISVKRVPSGQVSGFLHDGVVEGDLLDVTAPAGHFVLDPLRDQPLVLIGGGIGITPILSMVEAVCASGVDRETWVFYGLRDGAAAPFVARLRTLADRNAGLRLFLCHSGAAPAGSPARAETQFAGRVTPDLLRSVLPSAHYHFHLCGPPGMMTGLVAGLRDWGVTPDAIHHESFGPAGLDAGGGGGGPVGVEVRFRRSGVVARWAESFRTLLDVAESAGVVLDAGCRSGHCGACATALHEGSVTTIAEPGTPPPAGTCLPCVSRPAGPVVLDA